MNAQQESAPIRIVALIVLFALVFGGYALFSSNSNGEPDESKQSATTQNADTTTYENDVVSFDYANEYKLSDESEGRIYLQSEGRIIEVRYQKLSDERRAELEAKFEDAESLGSEGETVERTTIDGKEIIKGTQTVTENETELNVVTYEYFLGEYFVHVNHVSQNDALDDAATTTVISSLQFK